MRFARSALALSKITPSRVAELTFISFVLSLASTAALHFGDLPDPATGQTSPPNLEAASQMIEILALLDQKAEAQRGDLGGGDGGQRQSQRQPEAAAEGHMAGPGPDPGSQEPGSDAQIAEFCSSNYKVKFPLFSKIEVNGEKASPLYKYLTSLETKPAGKGKITWNFEKFLVGKNGQVVARFAPRTEPDAPEVLAMIEAELAKR